MITRVFDTPREQLWKAFTQPEIFKKWWGPKGFSCPVAEIDLRVGGKFFSCMKSSDGNEIWGIGTFREIKEPEKIVVTDSFADEKGNVVSAEHYGMSKDFPKEMLIHYDFEEQGDQSKLTLKHSGVPNLEMLNDMRVGWNESFDKLDDFLKYEELS